MAGGRHSTAVDERTQDAKDEGENVVDGEGAPDPVPGAQHIALFHNWLRLRLSVYTHRQLWVCPILLPPNV